MNDEFSRGMLTAFKMMEKWMELAASDFELQSMLRGAILSQEVLIEGGESE